MSESTGERERGRGRKKSLEDISKLGKGKEKKVNKTKLIGKSYKEVKARKHLEYLR